MKVRRTTPLIRLFSIFGLIALMAAGLTVTSSVPASASPDNLTQLNLNRLEVFSDWLKANHVAGEISEMGWPGDRDASEEAQWNSLASQVYAAAAADNLPVAAWATGETPVLDPFAYSQSQLSVIKAQPAAQRGLNLGGAEYAGDPFPSTATIKAAADAGVSWVRIPFSWEQLQPTSQGALDPVQVSRLESTVNTALNLGLTVEIENHNYARYNGNWTNSAELGNFWSRLAPLFPDHRVSFGIMEEPHDTPVGAQYQTWNSISQNTLTAIRNAGSTNLVNISANHFSNAYYWSCAQPTAWITDPANNFRYQADAYFDQTTVGVYSVSNDHNSYAPLSYNSTYSAATAQSNVADTNTCLMNNSSHVGDAAPPSPGGGNAAGLANFPGIAPARDKLVAVNNAAPNTGYHVVQANGKVTAFGNTDDFGSPTGVNNIAGIASTPTKRGYWLVSATGAVFAYGDATYYGGYSGPLNKPIVGIAATYDGKGYYLLGGDGGVFGFGSAANQFYGSTGSMKLNAPVVGMATSPSGNGYWLVASDGGVFAYGSGSKYAGSMGGKPLNKPVVGITASADNNGYWLTASDGGTFAFGNNAGFFGSMGGKPLNKPMIGLVASPGSAGYREIASDGGVFAYGDASFSGSLGGNTPSSPIVGLSY